jgi:AraC family ethanolamine operon transcriptional activator
MRLAGRHRRLRQARDFLAAHVHEPIYLDDLCAALGLTHRAVENIFHDFLGLSPTAYLRHQRLHGVRRALIRATPAAGAVKRAALEWGFWHQGHFSHDYYALFGEHPAETLRR